MISKRLRLHSALGYCIDQIEQILKEDILEIRRVNKIYGSNANAFILKTVTALGKNHKYVLKYGRNGKIDKEVLKTAEIQKYLPTPQIVLHSRIQRKFLKFEPHWMLFKFVEGKLLSELVHYNEEARSTDMFEVEEKKEILLRHMYQKSEKRKIEYKNYLNNETNKLFYKRFTGDRYKEFYNKTEDNISKYFDLRISINGVKQPYSINEIFDTILMKYKSNPQYVSGILGHGDCHHGNIICNGKKVWFIDNEYSDYISPAMELSKAYYTDYLGVLFYFFHERMRSYFEYKKSDINTKRINLIIQPKKVPKARIEIAKIKLKYRKEFLLDSQLNDVLNLNDYLVLCHTLVKNPNNYSEDIRMIFLAFISIISQFDPLDPESIYDYF